MVLRTELNTAMKNAMKSKQTADLATIRLILAAIKDRDIAAREHGVQDGVDDDSIRELLQKMIKQRGESIVLYEQGGRIELADSERAEIEVIKQFLPKQLDAAATLDAAKKAIESVGAEGIKDMGKVMASLRQTHGAALDAQTAAEAAKRLLTTS
jgi:uncharacterized protein YqeY